MLNILAQRRMKAIETEIRGLVSTDRLSDREISRLERLDSAHKFWKGLSSRDRKKYGVKPVPAKVITAAAS
ncbi:hypothetical protein [Hoeflea prorocentri]|uniref:Uncharacterized protein n=1 Tax=Hoeflea prorocentri TaxID=1922333 RepID=A0A9X3ZHN1_9HYPH|nr:hypothetical protein [Hoeflea prorocentri]MCY6382017.1 hypothetical protein [Hoeflea prorocentri]MDA5399817.1 hypothetical protein [Hoeflea prorocentri]